MTHSTDSHPHSAGEETRRERHEAAEHAGDARQHRREAAADRAEAGRDRAEGDRVEAVGNELEAEGHEAAAGAATAPSGNGQGLLGEEHRRRFRSRWDEIQASFIDEPRRSVSEADALVREATEALHSIFERDRRQLESVWDRGDDVSTEDLRVTLQRYRSFFERLVTT